MHISVFLQEAVEALNKVSLPTARLDSELLLGYVLGKDREWVIAHPEYEIDNDSLKKLEKLVQRRAKHEPIAYIVGSSEFYGREFEVNEHTLVPRPETETMIEMMLDRVESGKRKVESIVDVGTGSGAVGITASLELAKLSPITYHLSPILLDIDVNCLNVAKRNAKNLGVNADLLQGNLLEPISTLYPVPSTLKILPSTLILANLPYVPVNHPINQAATHEPKLALFGGADGLDLYRELFGQIAKNSQFDSEKLVIFTESLPLQHKELARIAAKSEFDQIDEQDFIQVFRFRS